MVPQESEAQNYDEYYSESNLEVPPFVHRRLVEIIGGFEPYRKTGRLLDIGFGAGTLMHTARNLGWKSQGVEVSKPAIEHSAGLGYEVFHGQLSEAKFPEGHFDVVTASEIIEHCSDPAELVSEVARILRPGGLFWATTPSSGGLSYHLIGLKWSMISPPEHLHLFSRKAIMRLLDDAGFADVKVRTYSFGVAEALSYFRKRPDHDRVQGDYALNEALTSSPFRAAIKGMLNLPLNMFRIGDSLKIYATK
ncbi:MAG TPA: class I SAM-dependent methyltransferase [Pyrinomonadaceae bacterium]|nr:class I SAM-dependent methyltransferase [Pyrinomonadaceae bacterium]